MLFNNPLAIRVLSLSSGQLTAAPLPDATVVALGNFDGVHCAHRALLSAVTRRAEMEDAHSAVFCFDPPSSDFLTNPQKKHLSTIEEKLSLFADCGIEYAILADFPSFQHMPPIPFIQQVLIDVCHAKAVVCGFNYRFGQYGAGNADLLMEQLGADAVSVIPPHCVSIDGDETVISSSVIRALLASGKVSVAARLLGQPYSLSSPVTHGKKLGHKLGFPTINQCPQKEKILPACGVYITRVWIDGKWIAGISNVGSRPTVELDADENCETHLLDFDRDVYGKTVTVEFLERLRGEIHFDSVDELRRAVSHDIETARRYFYH